ncbi:hypothetical protein RS9916_28174 [Synechococcus sp. RS9916]|nr:hypothetical protein RS9916_28174 [Synechococcus sp. RS9916]
MSPYWLNPSSMAAAAAERGLIERTWTHETHVSSTCGFNPSGFLD